MSNIKNLKRLIDNLTLLDAHVKDIEEDTPIYQAHKQYSTYYVMVGSDLVFIGNLQDLARWALAESKKINKVREATK